MRVVEVGEVGENFEEIRGGEVVELWGNEER